MLRKVLQTSRRSLRRGRNANFGSMKRSMLRSVAPLMSLHCRDTRKFHGSPTPRSFLSTTVATAAATAGGFGAFMFLRYRVSRPDQYLVRTGLGLPDMSVTKTGFQWPFQKYHFIEMRPRNYSFNLDAMSNQKMEFILPGVFTIGPEDDRKGLKNFARYLSDSGARSFGLRDEDQDRQDKADSIDELVRGIIEGETRVLAAQMTIEEIFNNRSVFKENIIRNVQQELSQFGLKIFNANIKELQDAPGSEYFQFMRQKTRSEAESKARVDIAEAKKKADIGEKERENVTRKQVAQYESDAVLKENETHQAIATSAATLEKVRAEALQLQEVARVESTMNVKMRETDMQRKVEELRVAQQMQALRAGELTTAQVHAEAIIAESEGQARSVNIGADAQLYAKQKEAAGILAVYDAQSEGVEKLMGSFQGDSDTALKYLMIDKDMYEKLAKTNAEAIRGLNPKITVWQTGNSGGDATDSSKPIADVLKMVPPLLTTIYDQTGLKPGKWLVDGLEPGTKDREP